MPASIAGAQTVADMQAVRERTLMLISHIPARELERVIDPLMSPLVWDLAHIAAYEDLWIAHRLAGLELLRPDLAATYDAFETPRAVRGQAPLLDTGGALEYLVAVRERTEPIARDRADEIIEMVIRHELQHTETMRQTMAVGRLLPAGDGPRAGAGGEIEDRVTVGSGTVRIGASGQVFSYDNERPRHERRIPGFAIGRRPLSNRAWAAAGGSPRPGDPDAPVCHVCWHEADELARAVGARLPTEFEWEHARTTGVIEGSGEVWEWTSSPFAGYPGFVAHPYREYSEVFFGDGYRVLRGGSWATSRRVATKTFRNWDLPDRSGIFAGVRLAWDLEASA